MKNKNYISYLREMVGDKKIILNAACVVLPNEKNEILLQKRSDNLKWGLPGGLMELDESIEECAIREVLEETNLEVCLTKFIGIFTNPNMTWRITDKAKVICYSFQGKITGGTLRINDSESLAFEYFSLEHLPEIHSPDNLETILAYYNSESNLVEGKLYHDDIKSKI
ncbi:MAG: NUDIX domain-containing protein [Firmicutes bacterium]|nr:NUDIX domain-containing protein [Bacillota bacterium]